MNGLGPKLRGRKDFLPVNRHVGNDGPPNMSVGCTEGGIDMGDDDGNITTSGSVNGPWTKSMDLFISAPVPPEASVKRG